MFDRVTFKGNQMSKQSNKPVTTVVLPTMLAIAALNKGIDDLCKDATSIQSRIGEVGIQCLMHLEANGDIGPANRLLVGLPKGVRRNALGSWMLTHGALSVNADAGTKKTAPVKFDKSKKTNVQAALADPWFSHQPEKPLDTVFDLQRAIHVMLTRAKGKTIMVHGKAVDPTIAGDMLKSMAALVGESFDAPVSTADLEKKVGEATV
jgi:hypothetical protein